LRDSKSEICKRFEKRLERLGGKKTKKRDVACEQALKGKYDGDSKRDVRTSTRWVRSSKREIWGGYG